MYDIPIEEHVILWDSGEGANLFLEEEIEEWHRENPPQPIPEGELLHFTAGQYVKFRDASQHDEPVKYKPEHYPDGVFLVTEVETVPDTCTCGLEQRSAVHMHPEGRCCLRRRFEMMHDQIVTILTGEGQKRYSGYSFLLAN